MNWFDTAGFANLAKSAFTSAQKTIDRALDIHEEKNTDVISFQLSEDKMTIPGEKIVHHHSPSTSTSSSIHNIEDNNDTDKLLSPDPKKHTCQNDQKLFDFNSEEQSKHHEYCRNKFSDVTTTVFSQPQQSLFPSGMLSSVTEGSWTKNRVKEDDSCMESDAKIDVHLTVTQMLTGLTPFLPQTSDAQQSLETKQQAPSGISLGKEDSDTLNVEEHSSNEKDVCVSDDSSICPLKSSSCTENSVDVRTSVTKTCEKLMKGSFEQDILTSNNRFLDQYLSHDRTSNSIINVDNSPEHKCVDICTPVQSLTPTSADTLSSNSCEQIEFDDKAFKSSCNWVIPFPCEPTNEGNRNQTNIESEIKELEVLELKECDIKSSDSLGSMETNSSSSFVKCSAGLSEVYSASDHSDAQKYECEHYSEHTSGEENETTSSDIEIISSPNGENGERQSSNHLKHTWLSRIYGRRSESPNSDSNFMPAVQEVEEDLHDQHLRPGFYEVSGSSIDGEDAEPSTKNLMEEVPDIEDSFKRQAVLEELVEDREKKLLKLSQEMAEFYDNNSRLEREIKRLEEIRNKDSQNTSEITQEFTQRIAQLEGKLFEATKERDIAKEKLEELEKEAHSRPCAAEVERIMKEKDQLITELMEEGEKLSKQQLQLSSLIKKLKNKDKEKENTLKTQKETLEEQSKEIERLRRSLGAKDDQEKKHISTIRQLTISIQEKEADLVAITSSLEKVREESDVMRKSLDSSYREMAELHRSNAQKEIQVQEIALSSEIAAKGEFQQAMEVMQKEAAKERETLLAELEELQHAKIQAEQEAKCREEALQSEIIEIQKRLQESENHAVELSKQISSATLPLLRQIDNLQSMLASRSASWEKSEENLFERLNELQNQVLFSEAQEKLTQQNCEEFSSKLSDVCLQLSTLKQEKMQLVSQLELAQMKIGMLEEAKNRECATVASVKEDMIEEINKLKLDKDELSCQVVSLQAELDIEKKKVQKLEDSLQTKLKSGGDKSSNGTSSPTMSRLSSVSEGLQNWMQDNHSDGALGMTLSTYSHKSLYDTVRLESAPSLLENFQSQLKQRDGEIALLQSEIFQLEKIRDSLGQELADVSSQYEALKMEYSEVKMVKANFSDMEQKYNTLLQMYGEKVEEAEELQLDLQDIKAMYRAQLDELLKKS